MSGYLATDYIVLTGVVEVSDAGGVRLVWTGQSNSTQDRQVVDVDDDGILTEGVDTFDVSGATYSGWYIVVDGRSYGIFETSISGIYVIPYDAAIANLGHGIPIVPEISETRSTTLHDPALALDHHCFMEGTGIATPEGPRPVESLAVGALVLTATGEAVPVRAVRRQDGRGLLRPGRDGPPAPIRLSAHALGPGRPLRDLVVTGDHALEFGGFLVNASALVNGGTIRSVPFEELPPQFSYWHVETDTHCLLLAEDCPAESCADYTARGGDHPDPRGAPPIPEMARPRITTARQLPQTLRARLGIVWAA